MTGSDTTQKKVISIGAGISAVCAVFGILEDHHNKDIFVEMIAPSDEPLPPGTATDVQPGRLTAGWHYPDQETAIRCVEPMIHAYIIMAKLIKKHTGDEIDSSYFAGRNSQRDSTDKNTKYIPSDPNCARHLRRVNKAIQKEFNRIFNDLPLEDQKLIKRLIPCINPNKRKKKRQRNTGRSSIDASSDSDEIDHDQVKLTPPTLSRAMLHDEIVDLQTAGLIPKHVVTSGIIETREMQWHTINVANTLRQGLNVLESLGLFRFTPGTVTDIFLDESNNPVVRYSPKDASADLSIDAPCDELVCAAYQGNFPLHYRFTKSVSEDPPSTIDYSQAESIIQAIHSPTKSPDHRSSEMTFRLKAICTFKLSDDTPPPPLHSFMVVYSPETAFMITPFKEGQFKATVGRITNLANCKLISGQHNGELEFEPYEENLLFDNMTEDEIEELRKGRVNETLAEKIGEAITAYLNMIIPSIDATLEKVETGLVISLGGNELQPYQTGQQTPSIHTRRQCEEIHPCEGITFFYTTKANWFSLPYQLGQKIRLRILYNSTIMAIMDELMEFVFALLPNSFSNPNSKKEQVRLKELIGDICGENQDSIINHFLEQSCSLLSEPVNQRTMKHHIKATIKRVTQTAYKNTAHSETRLHNTKNAQKRSESCKHDDDNPSLRKRERISTPPPRISTGKLFDSPTSVMEFIPEQEQDAFLHSHALKLIAEIDENEEANYPFEYRHHRRMSLDSQESRSSTPISSIFNSTYSTTKRYKPGEEVYGTRTHGK